MLKPRLPISYLLVLSQHPQPRHHPHRTFATMSGPPAKRLKVETDERTTALEPVMQAGQCSMLAWPFRVWKVWLWWWRSLLTVHVRVHCDGHTEHGLPCCCLCSGRLLGGCRCAQAGPWSKAVTPSTRSTSLKTSTRSVESSPVAFARALPRPLSRPLLSSLLEGALTAAASCAGPVPPSPHRPGAS